MVVSQFLPLMLGGLWCGFAKAESHMWLRNHTNEVLEIQTSARSTKPWVEGKHWTSGAKSVQPGEVVSVARFSRDRAHVSRKGAPR